MLKPQIWNETMERKGGKLEGGDLRFLSISGESWRLQGRIWWRRVKKKPGLAVPSRHARPTSLRCGWRLIQVSIVEPKIDLDGSKLPKLGLRTKKFPFFLISLNSTFFALSYNTSLYSWNAHFGVRCSSRAICSTRI